MNKQSNKFANTAVGLLTSVRRKQRNPDGCLSTRRLLDAGVRLAPGLVAAALLSFAEPAVATDWHSNAAISTAAENYVRDRYGKTDAGFAPKAANLDQRLRLHQCSAALETFVREGTKVGNRAIVGVRCHGPKPWKVYVPVEIVVMQSVLIASKTLPKGHVPSSSDVRIERRDISRMNGGYLSNVTELDGQRLKHQVIGGRVITPSMLTAEIVIRRGQSVTLIVRNDQISISMAGKALADRARNQRIKVENLGSGRIVEGIVRSAEIVEVLVR